jgi:LPXTG-motif cell wall-anchored protein
VTVDPLPKATYPAGQDKSVVKIDVAKNIPGHAKLLNASSELKGGVLTSSASIADVDILGLVKAKIVTSTCVSDGKTVTGDSKLVDVWVAGQKIDVALTGKISVTDAVTVYLNEKIASGDTLTVNALRVSVGGNVAGIKIGDVAQAEVILSQAKCAGPGTVVTTPGTPSTSPSTPPSSTPGGSVTATPSPTSSAVWPPSTTPTSTSIVPGSGGVTPVADTDDLAQTGVNAVIPLAIGGFVLVAGGAGAVWMVRRKRSAMQG